MMVRRQGVNSTEQDPLLGSEVYEPWRRRRPTLSVIREAGWLFWWRLTSLFLPRVVGVCTRYVRREFQFKNDFYVELFS